MATHSIILAWRSPWTEESGGLHRAQLSPWGHKESDTIEQLYKTPVCQIIRQVKINSSENSLA